MHINKAYFYLIQLDFVLQRLKNATFVLSKRLSTPRGINNEIPLTLSGLIIWILNVWGIGGVKCSDLKLTYWH